MKVIMMTALSSPEQRARGEALGADRYLVKSQVGIEDVVNTIHDVLNDKAAAPAAEPVSVAEAAPTMGAVPVAPETPAQPAAVQGVVNATPANPAQ